MFVGEGQQGRFANLPYRAEQAAYRGGWPVLLRQVAQHVEGQHTSHEPIAIRGVIGDHVVMLVRVGPPFRKVPHRQGRGWMSSRPVENIVYGNLRQHKPENAAGNVVGSGRAPFDKLRVNGCPGPAGKRAAGPAGDKADQGRGQQKVAEHHQHQERENRLVDNREFPEDQQQGNFGYALAHQPGSHRLGHGQPGHISAKQGADEVAGQGNQGQGNHGQRGNVDKVEGEMEAGGGKEEGNKDGLRCTAQSRHNFHPYLVRQARQGSAEKQGAEGTVEAHNLGAVHHQEQGAQEQTQGKLGHLNEPLQAGDQRRKHAGRQQPGDGGKPHDLGHQEQNAG